MKEKNQLKKLFLEFFLTVFILGVFLLPAINAEASIADEADPYEWGHTYKGKMDETGRKYYSFKVKKKSNVYISVRNVIELHYFYVRNAKGEEVISPDDYSESYNATTDMYTFTTSRILPAGTYYTDFIFSDKWSIYMTCEDAISLSKQKITSLSNSSAGKATVKFTTSNDRTGTQIRYSTSSKFKNAKTVTAYGTSVTLTKLTKKKTYYIKMREYAIYGNGGANVYGPWSTVKVIKITK